LTFLHPARQQGIKFKLLSVESRAGASPSISGAICYFSSDAILRERIGDHRYKCLFGAMAHCRILGRQVMAQPLRRFCDNMRNDLVHFLAHGRPMIDALPKGNIMMDHHDMHQSIGRAISGEAGAYCRSPARPDWTGGTAIVQREPMILPFLISIIQPISSCVAIDGDTLRCTEIGRVRLLGIDAPEMPGHCRKGRICAPGNPQKSKANLARLIRPGVTIAPVTRDRYGRTVALVYAGSRNVACEQLKARHAIYRPKWDNGRRLAADCKLADPQRLDEDKVGSRGSRGVIAKGKAAHQSAGQKR
jgi:micrococcal nuclease